jgi:hypothetical protein
MKKTLIGVAIGAGMLAFAPTVASAAIACSGNVCWHTTETYTYPRHARVIIRDDNWRAGRHIRWREREGRGYWRNGVWVTF